MIEEKRTRKKTEENNRKNALMLDRLIHDNILIFDYLIDLLQKLSFLNRGLKKTVKILENVESEPRTHLWGC